MRTIGVVTVARSDWSYYLPVLKELRKRDGLRFRLYVTGAHLSERFGHTVDQILADGFAPDVRVPMLVDDDSPRAIARSMGAGTAAFADVFATDRPDILLVYGDRFEMHAAALAALPFTLPVAHISGGEVTEGAIDDALRHSITKLSHLHFVIHEDAAHRVRQLGEEAWRVLVTGDPNIDLIREYVTAGKILSRAETAKRFGLDPDGPNLLVVYHPVTLQPTETSTQIAALLDALRRVDAHLLFAYPNEDTAWRTIIAAIEAFAQQHPRTRVVVNAGPLGYLSLLAHVDAMVGNSSSGFEEAPSFELPAVNVGIRQRGRLRSASVIDCGNGSDEILAAIHRALAPETRRALKGCVNPYGDGHAAPRIVNRLADVALDAALVIKRFADLGR